jgi:ribosomal protein S2
MKSGSQPSRSVSAIPLLNAVFCADCETITNSPHEGCAICGSRSLINLFRMVGGTLRNQKIQSIESSTKTANYNLELNVKVRELPGNELNRLIESMNRLAEVCGGVESVHTHVEFVPDTQSVLRAA